MKKKIILFILCFIILLGVCGCSNEKDKSNTDNKEKTPIVENENIENDTETNDNVETNNKTESNIKPNTNNKTETTNTTESNSQNQATNTAESNNQTETNSNTEEDNLNHNDIPSVNKKIVVCDQDINRKGYNASLKYTVTFENDSIVYFTMYTIKSFIDDYKAENDDWTISNMESLKNNTRKGLSGNIYIETILLI